MGTIINKYKNNNRYVQIFNIIILSTFLQNAIEIIFLLKKSQTLMVN